MKGFILFAVLVVVLLAGGGLTMQLLSNNGAPLLPYLRQVASPDASPAVMQDWKASQLFILISVIIGNLIGIAATLALIFWFVDRGLKKSKAEAEEKAAAE